MKKHNHATTSNTGEVYRTFIGCKVKGLVQEATFDGNYAQILVFECGWGLAINSNGSHWTVNPEDLAGKVSRAKNELNNTKKELQAILLLAGEEESK